MIRQRYSDRAIADAATASAAISRRAARRWAGFAIGAALLLAASVGLAQTAAQPPAAPAQIPQPADQTPQPAPPPSASPNYHPGFIDAVGRWMHDSTAGFNANVNSAWEALPGRGMSGAASDAASNAARSTVDAAKGVGEAGQGVANAMGNAARDTAGALTRLPGARIAVGRERCTVAPNGAPDCRLAAQALCRAKGFGGGSSVDIETSESCPPDASLQRWRGETVVCATDNFVTRSLCQ